MSTRSTLVASMLPGGSQTVPLVTPVAPLTWAAQPAAVTEFLGLTLHRVAHDLSRATQARLSVLISTIGATGAALRAQYSLNSGGAWAGLDGGTGPSVTIDALGLRVGSWVSLEAAAKADVWLRLVGVGGDGFIGPIFGTVSLELR